MEKSLFRSDGRKHCLCSICSASLIYCCRGLTASERLFTGSVFSLIADGLRFSITYFSKVSQRTPWELCTWLNFVSAGIFAWFQSATDAYLYGPQIGVYQIFSMRINLVTYVLYRKNKIRPRFRLLLMDSY